MLQDFGFGVLCHKNHKWWWIKNGKYVEYFLPGRWHRYTVLFKNKRINLHFMSKRMYMLN